MKATDEIVIIDRIRSALDVELPINELALKEALMRKFRLSQKNASRLMNMAKGNSTN